MRTIAWFGALFFGAYLGALVAVSLGSEEVVLPAGETQRFCGAYLDCHLGIAVLEASVPQPAPAARTRRVVVRVRLSSDARRARLALHEPTVAILDEHGRRWKRSRAAERDLGLSPDRELGAPLEPGGHRDVTLAFELPADVRSPRLLARTGGLDSVAELFLIGDDDSLLHAPVTHALSIDG